MFSELPEQAAEAAATMINDILAELQRKLSEHPLADPGHTWYRLAIEHSMEWVAFYAHHAGLNATALDYDLIERRMRPVRTAPLPPRMG